MKKITSVEPQKNNPKRFNIFLDGEFTFGADEDLIVNERLIVGKIIQKEELDKLLFEASVGKLMERIYGLFSVRGRSEKEVRDYLKKVSFKRKIKDQEEISQASIDLIIERLKQKKILNDLEFAKAWVESRRRSKGKSKRALKMELMQKGINREIIEEVISAIGRSASGGSEEELAEKALEKKLKSWQSYANLDKKRKAYEYLMRKGFDYELVKDVVEKILKIR